MIKYFFGLISLSLLISCQQNTGSQYNIDLIDSKVFNEILEDNEGKVIVVNVWATWCVPCVEEMPDLVKLSDSYESGNVKVIGISIDYPEEIQSKILPFIKKNKINFPVYVNNFKNDEALINFLNKDWSGAIPVTFVYDKTGVQKEILLGKHSFDNFKSAVEKYL